MNYRLHVISLAHTQTTQEYLCCAYTQKVIKFCKMMKDMGNTVYLYAGEENEAECDELIPCVLRKYSPSEYTSIPFSPTADHWVYMNNKVIEEIEKRKLPKDFICVIAGLCQKPIADHFKDCLTVEFGIGYSGVFSNYKVFESSSWMHTVYGAMYGADTANGNFYDTVIPNYFNPDDFEYSDQKEDYLLYVGRIIDRKGIQIVEEICKATGDRLLVAGPGEYQGSGEYIGVLNQKDKSKYMSKAKAVLMPTLYLEPFGGVMIESFMCGTPVISTNWGAFRENNIDGITGYRCNILKEFCEATRKVEGLDYQAIRKYAIDNFSMEVIKFHYQDYFDRLYTLWNKGWYELPASC